MSRSRRHVDFATDDAITTDPFHLRWHAIANRETPSADIADIMSSPDPLNDDTSDIAVPSSQRVTRSQRSDRFVSLSGSPRKQRVELEFNHNRSSRSPFSTRDAVTGATTTTVPLKDSIEEEYADTTGDSLSTPRRRTRARKTNGTPIPGASKKRRAGTPIRRTPRRTNTEQELDPLADQTEETTPTPKRRTRATLSLSPRNIGSGDDVDSDQLSHSGPTATPTPKRRRTRQKAKSIEPSSEVQMGSTPAPDQDLASPTPRRSTRKRKNPSAEPPSDGKMSSASKTASVQKGRRRRQALAPEDLREIAEPRPEPTTFQPTPSASDDDMDLVASSRPSTNQAVPAAEEPPSDLWMATLSDDATPRAASTAQEHAPDRLIHRSSDAGGYGEGAASGTYASSETGESQPGTAQRNNTVAQEDFSMIFMDSIPSLQEFRNSVPGQRPPTHNDMGEETNQIINNTLESLRQSARMGDLYQDGQEQVSGIVPGGDQYDEFDFGPAAADEMGFLEEQRDEDFGLEQYLHEDAMNQQDWAPNEEELPEDDHTAESHNHAEVPMETVEEEATSLESTPPASRHESDELASADSLPVMSSAVAWSSRTHRAFSPSLARSPYRSNISPLRRQALGSALKKADATPRVGSGGSPVAVGDVGAASNRINEEESNTYEDSFSEIPQEILEAATPRRPVTKSNLADEIPVDEMPEEELHEMEGLEDSEEEEGAEEEDGNLEQEQQEEADEEEELQDNGEFVDHPSNDNETHEDAIPETVQPFPSAVNPAAPTDHGRLPTPDDTPPNIGAEADQSPDKSAQPSQLSSPSEAHAQLTSENNAASPQVAPTTSHRDATPLHQMSSPPQEPASAGGDAASDKAPRPALSAIVRAGRVLQTVTSDPPSPDGQDRQLGSPFRSSTSKDSWSGSREPETRSRPSASVSPGRRSVGHQRQSVSMERSSQDPFGSATRNTGQESFMQALGQSTRGPANKLRESPGSSMRVTPPDEEMSWVAEAGPISPRLRGDVAFDHAAPVLSTTNVMRASLRQSPAEEPVEEPAEGPGAHTAVQSRDDETDIWELEAQREDPVSSPHQASLGYIAPVLPHRRTALPSPWRSLGGPLGRAANFGASTQKQPGPNVVRQREEENPEGESEEFSLLAQGQQQTQAADAGQAAGSSAKANRFDLSSFFSSPSAIPGKLVEKFFPSRSTTAPAPPVAMSQRQDAPPVVPTSSMFPSAPQGRSEPASKPQPSKAAPPRPVQRHIEVIDHGSASPDTPEQLRAPMSTQRKTLTPRPRQTNMSFFQSSSAQSRSMATPPRMQLSHADIQRWQQETSNSSSNESESPPRPFLRPLPPKNASPIKSSMRSPLKPHTPGRVVEFTSSVLSPLEQARHRQLRQQQPDNPVFFDEPTDPQPWRPEPVRVMGSRETQQDSDVSMSDAPMPPKPTPMPESLSQTDWTREHWLFMDKLLQHRRNAPFGMEVERTSDRLLGKTINSRGQYMVLERWHLDCVDAFKAVVGGWDETALAKRLFALIMGEEKRRRRGVSSHVMFH